MQIVDFEYRKELIAGKPSLAYCFQCATCSGGCPVALKTGGKYNPRKIIQMSLLGLGERLVEDPTIWLCSTCQKCVEYCPQRVDLTEIFTEIKNRAVRAGHRPDSFVTQGQAILSSGMAIPLSPAILRRRKQLNLPEFKPAGEGELKVLFDQLKLAEKMGLKEG
ncbi:MAG: CoB--CoM heterodisulfide reductase subunit C [Promethearchaeota archaeon]